MSGLEVCRRIKTNPETAAMIVLHLSATSVREADRVQALEYGADSYLVEPIEPDELVANIHALLRMRRAEATLRQHERQLQGILDRTPSIVFMKDLDGRYLLVNRQWERIMGVSLEEIKGKTDYDVFTKEEADAYRTNDRRMM